MNKKEIFDDDLQELAEFAKIISHPARLAILKYLASIKTCISGDITDHIPLSRSTVSQHLSELKKFGLIQGETQGLKIKYCLNPKTIRKYKEAFNIFFDDKSLCEDYQC
ncbi:MAG: metalloregulator ArsR/SmtB family transcription factor [Marinifilaceae bacterium]|nr:metalloregulator ArsR/SmtB family transcription factor [Marinifilaceae bacterium]